MTNIYCIVFEYGCADRFFKRLINYHNFFYVDPNGKLETFQSIRCLGQRIILSCKDSDKVIRIDSALLGRHSTDTDYCIKKTLACQRNVTNDFSVHCDGKRNCDYGFSGKYKNDKCGIVKFLALDISYNCGKITD